MADEETTGGADPGPVPYHRFKEVNDALKALRAKVAELEPRASEADTLRGKLDELKGAHKAELASLGTHLAMADSGLTDPLGREVAQLVYSRQPEEGRPPLVDWLKGLRSEGADVPAPLRPYLSPTQDAKPATQASQVAGAVTATATTGRAPPATGNVTAQAIRQAEADFRRTGDRASYETALRNLKVIP